jgi:AmmeMemoRadiSam system protein B
MTSIRPVAVAGWFYPEDPEDLHAAVKHYLSEADDEYRSGPLIPKAIIAPHAEYPYSAPVAAPAYVALHDVVSRIRRVVLLGPNHRVPLNTIAATSADAFATPNGDIRIDRAAIDGILELPQVEINDEAHAKEHSLEVHLPFLQEILGEFALWGTAR